MIQATFFKDSEGRYRGFSLLGHAGYATSGSDIVCSAVTALAFNTVNSIEALTSDNKILVYNTDKETGLLTCTFDGKIGPESTLLVDSLLLGLKYIRKSYKENIKISIKEV